MQVEKLISKKTEFNSNGVVLVTGGAGRLGRRIISELLSKGITVRALVKEKSDVNLLPFGTVPYVGDITSEDVIFDACKGIDTVYHFAAIVSQREKGHKEILRVNSAGTKMVLEAADLGGAKRIILSSSVDVYGSKRNGPLTEASTLMPNDMYGHSKMLAEKQIESFHGNISYTILRMATIYGEEFKDSFFKIFKLINNNKAYMIGNGKNHLSLVHIDDVARAMILARSSQLAANKIYNLTDGKVYTQESLFNLAAELLNKKQQHIGHINTLVAKVLSKKAGITIDDMRFITSNRIINIDKISKELGFKPTVDIKVAGKELVDSFLLEYKGN